MDDWKWRLKNWLLVKILTLNVLTLPDAEHKLLHVFCLPIIGIVVRVNSYGMKEWEVRKLLRDAEMHNLQINCYEEPYGFYLKQHSRVAQR